MKNLGGTVILLLVALVLLWLAVTNQLGRLLDAWAVVRGKATTSPSTVAPASLTGAVAPAAAAVAGSMIPSLPSLPALGTMAMVGA